MKFILSILTLTLLISCASRKADQERLEKEIKAEEVRSLEEIRSRAQMLLDSHPELKEDVRNKIKSHLDVALVEQKKLKDEESKVLQILLYKSLRAKQLTRREKKDKRLLAKRLTSIYKSKAQITFTLVSQIIDLSDKNELNESFEKDMFMFIRELR